MLRELGRCRSRTPVQRRSSLRRFFGGLGVVILGACGLYYSWSERIGDGSRLPSSNSVELRITSGDVTVVGSTAPDFRVSFDGHPAGSAKDTPVSIDRNRQPVLIEISKLPQGVRALVEIPERSHLAVRMGAGELSIHGMRSDLYAVLRAGKLLIDVGEPSDYRAARGSVLAGALHAPAFSADKGGMFPASSIPRDRDSSSWTPTSRRASSCCNRHPRRGRRRLGGDLRLAFRPPHRLALGGADPPVARERVALVLEADGASATSSRGRCGGSSPRRGGSRSRGCAGAPSGSGASSSSARRASAGTRSPPVARCSLRTTAVVPS